MLFVLTGDGKGKTTCACGMGVRAVGAGRNVLMVQFLKTGFSSEIKIIENIPNFSVKSYGRNVCISKDNITKEDYQLALTAFNFAKENLTQKKCDFLILDEINVALRFGLLDEAIVISFLTEFKEKNDIVLTGRYCPESVIAIADLATEMKEVRHYFNQGYHARKGVEF